MRKGSCVPPLNQILGLVFVFAVGFAGFLVFRRLKTPSPGLLGSIFATGLLNAAGYYPALDTGTLSFLAKTATGTMLGRQINRQLFERVKGIVPFVLISSSGMFAVSLATGFATYTMTDASLKTALIAGAAGGMTEMTTFGMSVQADVVVILFMQVLRLVVALTLSPYIALLVERLIPGKRARVETGPVEGMVYFGRFDYLLLIVSALAGAWLFVHLNIPNGTMMGAMLACGLLSVLIRKTYRFDFRIRYVAQIALGLVMGQRMTPDVMGELQRLILPGLVSTVIMMAGTVLLALLLYKTSPLDLVTCILCTSPAGLSQIALFADEIGADSLTVSIFHIFRLLSIIAFYPWIVMAIV